jgi:hypothetical protein
MARWVTRSKSSVSAVSMALAALWACGRTDPETPLAEPTLDAAQQGGTAGGPADGGDGDGTSQSGGSGGTGGASLCPSNETICSGAGCVDLSNDSEHCGRCGQACTMSQVCVNGACACPSGTVPCGSSGCCPPIDACGNGSCADGESCADCPADCGPCASCGDQVCDGTETCESCEADCGACVSCSCREFCRVLRRCGGAGIMCRSSCDTATPSYMDCVCRASACEDLAGCF